MKRFLLALMVILTMCSLANAQNQTTVLKDSIGKIKVTVKKSKEAKADEQSTAVTVVGVDTNDTDSLDSDSTFIHTSHNSANINFDTDDFFPFKLFGTAFGAAVLVPIVAIIMVFGLPIFVIFLVFFFRYKNRKARYRLAEQALAAGQPLPEEFIRESRLAIDQHAQGIKNIFLGIGLFIFLWGITGEFGIGAIGLLVMFIGIGQWVTDRQREKKNEQLKATVKAFEEKKNEEKNEEN